MGNNYEKPRIEILDFLASDIIRTSGGMQTPTGGVLRPGEENSTEW